MTRLILLLLVALTGPFCTFTRASSLVVPTTSDPDVLTESDQPAVTNKAEEQAAPSTAVPVHDTTETSATASDAPVVSTEVQVQPDAQTEPETPVDPTSAPETEETLNTTATDEPGAVPEEFTKTEAETNGVEVIDDEEAMGTGQLVGIVIGALIAVIVVIAVIVLVVRRMGQYSP